jgi:biotin carboxyl carrier protein
MKLQVLVNGNTIEVDPDRLQAVVQVEPGVYSVIIDGRSFEVRAAAAREGLRLELAGTKLGAEVLDPRASSRRTRASRAGGRQNITAPMPGKVIRVLVSTGDTVETGQGLVVVEAMKMQNELKALHPGSVLEVRVANGETVGAGDTLVVIG